MTRWRSPIYPSPLCLHLQNAKGNLHTPMERIQTFLIELELNDPKYDMNIKSLHDHHISILSPNRFNFRTFRWMQTMIFAIEQINRDSNLLPNVTLGYRIYDSCSTPHHALKAAMDLMGREKSSVAEAEVQGKGSCSGIVPVVIGDGGSTQSLVVARFLGVFDVPQVRQRYSYPYHNYTFYICAILYF